MTTFFTFLLACYATFLAHIVVHMCAHRSLGRHAGFNRLVGNLLSTVHLMNFSGWHAAHMLHHRYTNTERDPHRVDCSLPKYLLLHYIKISKPVWDMRRFLFSVGPPLAVWLSILAYGVSQGRGLEFLQASLLYWLIPVAVSHMLMAHFNYVTHVGKPIGRGQDTRSLDRGLMKVVNLLTFNFYLHEEHHLAPGHAIPRRRSA